MLIRHIIITRYFSTCSRSRLDSAAASATCMRTRNVHGDMQGGRDGDEAAPTSTTSRTWPLAALFTHRPGRTPRRLCGELPGQNQSDICAHTYSSLWIRPEKCCTDLMMVQQSESAPGYIVIHCKNVLAQCDCGLGLLYVHVGLWANTSREKIKSSTSPCLFQGSSSCDCGSHRETFIFTKVHFAQ